MLEKFTVEESNLICIFDRSSRNNCISEIKEAMPHFDDADLTEIAESVIKKLEKMSDLEFAALELYPADEDTEV